MDTVFAGHDFVVREGSTATRNVESVANLNAFDCLDSHEGRSELSIDTPIPVNVATESGWESMNDDFDHSAKSVAGNPGSLDLVDHCGTRRCISAAHRIGVDCITLFRRRDHAIRQLGRADRHDVTDHLGPRRLSQEGLGNGPKGHTCCGFAGAGSLENRSHVVEVVLLNSHEVGVARPRACQRGVARLCGKSLGVHRVGRHDGLPLGPLGVTHLDRDRPTHGEPMPHPTNDPNSILLELHASAASVTEATAGQLRIDIGRRHLNACREPISDRHQHWAVRLTSCQPTQHA
jgi:hypothetical protein